MRALLLALFLALPGYVVAQEAGHLEFQALKGMLTGNVGLAIGLLLTVWGLWKAFIGGDTGAGLLIMVCGVVLTIFPNVFTAVSNAVSPLVSSVTGG